MSLHSKALSNQNIEELRQFCNLLAREEVRSYLEIGSKYGGSLWSVSQVLAPGAKIVAVDLPWGDKSTEAPLRMCVEEITKRHPDTHLILGDSTDQKIIDKVKSLGHFDAILIDANHTEPYVRKDWENYGPLGRIVAFHDISWQPRPNAGSKLPIDVPKVWLTLKNNHRHEEIKLDARDNGFGILWT